ncbi:FAD-dependent pyridine nucleotide-disulfide oxidoreductase family protein [Citrifermentans bemidjiense Bem]|uniref:FAD-dependent pyridine nucleotide-disulfide oxidoreductase family protein n=1 Tax=Citrifermentans bemidjiense (strain ATCC BAA-1014 / DSM 16622 / JCM 12645 / Bem) TaxID=404380 RepID=B5EGN9_CITBB|nr:NAD(P)-binding domain-containing protein [Citrifermentans bemidjiense]ACH39522.1 FAD-dependent pyridine nucleotide-disulfide oxidoreductase family protein [Citrifermentans bemidjiense Bem]
MDQKYDVLIVGGGPGGVAAAYICHKLGLSHLLIESGKAIFQGIANTYPEGKNVYPSKPKENPEPFLVEELRPPDKPVTVEKYIQYVQHFVQHEGLNVLTDTQFENIEDGREYLKVLTSRGTFQAKRVLLAFGSSIPKELSVYGDAKMVAKGLDDPKKYIGVRTLVIGGGNSAADVIISILKEKRNANDTEPVYWAHVAETFDVNKETAQRLGEEILLGGNIRLLPGATPRIGEVDDEGVDRLVIRVSEDKIPGGIERYHAMSFPMKNVIACIGSQGPTSIYDRIGVQTIACAEGVCQVAKEGDRLLLLTSDFESTRKGVYVIGGAISPSYMRINKGAIQEERHPNLIYTAVNDAHHVIDAIAAKLKK